MPKGDPIRICTEVDREFGNRLNEVIPWGLRKHLLQRLLYMTVEAVERRGEVMLGLILSGDVVLRPSKEAVQKLNAPNDE